MADKESRLGPAARYRHEHPPIRNVLSEHEKKMSAGERVADQVAATVGSWPFIIIQSFILGIWIILNVYLAVMIHTHPGYLKAWDPYPFILLNLVLSFQAAYTGPVVMMSQNRQGEKDRLMAQNDYEVNQKAEQEICVIMEHLTHQDELILDAVKRLESLQVEPPVQQVAQKVEEILSRLDLNDRRIVELIERMERIPTAPTEGI